MRSKDCVDNLGSDEPAKLALLCHAVNFAGRQACMTSKGAMSIELKE